MEMNNLFDRLITAENNKWCERLTQEIKKLTKMSLKIDYGDIQMKYLEILRLASEVLAKFTESVSGKDSALVFEKEMEEINKLTEIQALIEQLEQTLQTKYEILMDKKGQLNLSKSRIK